MLTILGFAVWLVVWRAPNTLLGRVLRRALVEHPAERLSRVRRGQVLILLLLAAVSIATVALLKSEGAFLVAGGLPEGLTWVATFDVASYFDILALGWLFAASVRLRAVKAVLGSLLARTRPRGARRAMPRSRTPRRRPAAPPPANSDGEGWAGFALAA